MRKILLTLLVTFFTLFANAVEVRWYNATSDKPYYQTITYSEVGTDSATAAYIIKTNATASNTMVKTTANGSAKSGYWSAKTTASGSDFCDSIYVTFQVKTGYTFTFTHLTSFVAKVAGTATFKGFIKDNNGHELTSSQSSSTSDVNISFTSMSGTSFSGIVKVGLAFFSNEKSSKNVYLANNLQFTGSISSSGGSTTYTVTYNGNGNTGGTAPTDASSPYAAGSNVTVLGNTGSLVKTGYVFGGWNTAANGSGTNYAAGATISGIAANTTLYAKWTPVYTVTYNGNGNTGGTAPTDASSPYAAGSNVTVLGNTGSLVKTGYTFDGWNTVANGSGTNYAAGATISGIAANTTLYAKWTEDAVDCTDPDLTITLN